MKMRGVESIGKTEHEVKPSSCLACGYEMDRATMINGDSGPAPGDMTLCMRCRHLMAFADDLSLRELTDSEIMECAGDRRIVELTNALGRVLPEAKREK